MPITVCRKCLSVRSFANGIAGLFLLFAFGLYGMVLHAQIIKIKLVDGRNGHAMADTCVNVGIGNEHKPMMAVPTDRAGIALLRLTDKDSEIDTKDKWQACGDFGVVNPVVKYDRSIGINAGYVLCQFRQPDHTWLTTQKFSTEEVLQSGIVTANMCGKATASPTPGEIVIFVRHLKWWEKFKQ